MTMEFRTQSTLRSAEYAEVLNAYENKSLCTLRSSVTSASKKDSR